VYIPNSYFVYNTNKREMGSLSEISNNIKSTAEILLERGSGFDINALLCFGDQACLYETENSPTGLMTCDKNGLCKVVKTCPENRIFVDSKQSCMELGTECETPLNHRLFKYTEQGCEQVSECEPNWRWNDISRRCDFARNGEICDRDVYEKGVRDTRRISRLDVDGNCVTNKECTAGVYSEYANKCVIPGEVCGDTGEDRRIRKFDFVGACSASDECIENWSFSNGSCVWSDFGKECKPNRENVEIDFVDDKRAFEYDATGACISTNRCLDSWVYNGIRCVHPNTGKTGNMNNGRNFVYNSNGNLEGRDCIQGWTLKNDNCVFDKIGETCRIEDGIIFQYGSQGECMSSGKCENPDNIYSDGKCITKPEIDPELGPCPFHINQFVSSGPNQYTLRLNINGGSPSCVRRAVIYGLVPSDKIRVSLNVSGPKKCDRVVQFRSENHFSIHQQVGTNFNYTSGFTTGLTVYKIYCDMRCMEGSLEFFVDRTK
jgi:hypothetical protein